MEKTTKIIEKPAKTNTWLIITTVTLTITIFILILGKTRIYIPYSVTTPIIAIAILIFTYKILTKPKKTTPSQLYEIARNIRDLEFNAPGTNTLDHTAQNLEFLKRGGIRYIEFIDKQLTFGVNQEGEIIRKEYKTINQIKQELDQQDILDKIVEIAERENRTDIAKKLLQNKIKGINQIITTKEEKNE